MKKTLLIVASTLVVAAVTFLVTTSSDMFDAGEREILEGQGDTGARVEPVPAVRRHHSATGPGKLRDPTGGEQRRP